MSTSGLNRHAPLTVLLVDDDALFLPLAESCLEALGFRVIPVESGMKAVEVAKGGDPDFQLVVTDFRMPCMDGVETLEALRRIRPGLKAILSSGNTEWECLQGRALEDCVFLGKPYRIDDLDEAVDRVLEGGAGP